jgi:uncharacterized membrane protein YkoI
MNISRRYFVSLLIAFTVLPAQTAMADRKRHRRGDDDDERNRERHDYRDAANARRSGDIVPLRDILDEVRKTHPGEIVGIEFEREDGIWVYEIKLVTPEGRYLEIYVDAKTKKIIEIEGK